jgi:hypothetical protein
MEDIEKIAKLFLNEQFKLAFELCNAIEITHYELIEYIWDNYAHFDEYLFTFSNNLIIQKLISGSYILGTKFEFDYLRYITKERAFNKLIKIINEWE